MIAEYKGPIVLSACIHFVGVLGLLIASMILPSKAPEPFEFIMYGDPGAQVSNELPQLEALNYEIEDVDMPDPKLFEPVIPEPEPEPEPVVEVLPEPEPVAEIVEPTPEVVPEVVPEKPKVISLKSVGEIKPTNIPNRPAVRKPRTVDLSSVNRDLQKMISSSRVKSTSMSAGDQRSWEAYMNSLAVAIRDSVELHTPGPVPLVVEIAFNLAANGSVTGARVVKSSGDKVYDQKVLAAFRAPRVRYFQETPFGKSHELILPVRQQD